MTGAHEHIDVVIIGGGQAGLALSYYLKQQGRQHVIVEQARLWEAWQSGRWDSFALITPNARTFTLPGLPYTGDSPDGFSALQDIQNYLRRYVAMVDPPVRLGVRATSVRPENGGGYAVETTAGTISARTVVVATGLLQQPRVPSFAAQLPGNVQQMHASRYRNPSNLPVGNVLVVGTGQSGCPIAEELNNGQRRVYLSLGTTGRAPGRYRGKSKAWWVPALGLPVFAEDGLAKSPLAADPGGGREYNPHQFARDGMTLLGRVIGARDSTLEVAPNLYDVLRASDRSEADFRRVVDEYVLREHLDVPDEPPAEVLDDGYRQQVIRELDVHSANITSIVWCTGYQFDFSWVHLPVFDEMGYPIHASGVTASPGLYFLGMHWRSRPVSAFVGGVAAEAAHIAAHIDARGMRPTDMRRVAGS